MPRRLVKLTSGQFYHVYNRGNNKEKIFLEKRNYHFFLDRLAEFVNEAAVVHAYCLLPNHYHLLVKVLEGSRFAKAFEKFLISYVKSVNAVYGRVGHLFQGRYCAKLVGSEDYLLHLSRYIHLNPLSAGLVKKAEDWEYSSYRDYVGPFKSVNFLETKFILSHFGGVEDYRDFVEAFAVERMQEIERRLWEDET